MQKNGGVAEIFFSKSAGRCFTPLIGIKHNSVSLRWNFYSYIQLIRGRFQGLRCGWNVPTRSPSASQFTYFLRLRIYLCHAHCKGAICLIFHFNTLVGNHCYFSISIQILYKTLCLFKATELLAVVDVSVALFHILASVQSSRFLKKLTEEASTLAGNLFHVLIILWLKNIFLERLKDGNIHMCLSFGSSYRPFINPPRVLVR